MDGTSIVRRPPFGTNPLVGERGSSTQRRILEAALEVFGEAGFHDARVELITKAAGCSRPAFYQYFSSKDDVFWKLAGQLGDEMAGLADRLGTVTPDRQGVDHLGAWLDDFAQLYDDYAPVFSAFQAAIRNREPLARGSSGISNRMGEALIRAFEPHDHDLDVEGLATALVSVLVRCNFYRHSQAGDMSRQRFTDGLAQIVHRLLAGPIGGVNLDQAAGPAPRRPALHWPDPPELEPGRALRPRGEKTRQRLLDAATVVLPERGYHDTRVHDIVEQAGVAHGSFYRYFENKDDLFRVLAEQAASDMTSLLEAFPHEGGVADLESWLEGWFATYRRNGGVISTWQEIEHSDARTEAFAHQTAASVFDRLVHIISDRPFGDPLVDALALLALIERVPYSVLTLGYPDEAQAIDAMVVILRRGLLGVGERATPTAAWARPLRRRRRRS